MTSQRFCFALVVGAMIAVPGNLLTAQDDSQCSGSERIVFSDARPPELTVTRDGTTMLTLRFEPGTLVATCFDQLGPQGEMIGDVVIRATRGERTDADVRQTVTRGGAPIVISLSDVEVTR